MLQDVDCQRRLSQGVNPGLDDRWVKVPAADERFWPPRLVTGPEDQAPSASIGEADHRPRDHPFRFTAASAGTGARGCLGFLVPVAMQDSWELGTVAAARGANDLDGGEFCNRLY